ncbi:MAG: N-6 DNA methylase, partial [Verrucomicrobiae bacterium]|nr:N-6 DNA methylase [Verrucomicrobiae bacterium]
MSGTTLAPTLQDEANRLVSRIGEVLQHARSEEDLRIGTEKIFEPLLREIGLEPTPHYEHFGSSVQAVYRGRPDAVHGQVIIEYEAPRSFASPGAVERAHEQLAAYMTAAAEAGGAGSAELLRRLVGVGFDGEEVFFLRYSPETEKPGQRPAAHDFARGGPYSFDAEAARTFLTHLRALSRLPLTAERLAEKFGPSGRVAPLAVSAFADALTHWSGARVSTFLSEWKRLFGIVYGERFFTSQAAEKAAVLSNLYGVVGEADFPTLLFCVHSYFAMLMKLIAAELVTLSEGTLAASFCHRLTHAGKDDFRRLLTEIEDGTVYARRGITNFLEGDFFRWYLDALGSLRLEEGVRETARALSEFEPATTAIDPDSARDLLKKLYQFLVPQEIRHDLGEYYTPDWLAELVLDEVGYDGNTRHRLLDPACGSGTFLVLAIQRARQYGRRHREPSLETAKRIVANLWGFDLNPLAVIAARTNFLFALGELAKQVESFEIPIYLADSVLWPETTRGQIELNFTGEEYVKIPTSVGEFHVPLIWVKQNGFLMRQAAPLIEQMTKQGYEPQEALQRLRKAGLVFAGHESIVKRFYNEIRALERENKNGIWARFLKNTFAPMIADKMFDFVVGNPPWVRWGYLSQDYREATLPLWKKYGLFSLKGHAARLGGGEKDFSMLFTYAAADYYLKRGGKLGFLITQEVFKSKGAGEGFRRFAWNGEKNLLKVLKAHDLATVQPFEGAVNKAAAIILKKGSATKYPVPYTVWRRKPGVGRIPTNLKLKEARRLLSREKLMAEPIQPPGGSWQTLAPSQLRLRRLQGENVYQARLGARVEPYGVFWLEVKSVLANKDLLVRNLCEMGKRKVPAIVERVEPDLVFPAVRGADIQRWRAKPGVFVLMVQNPQTCEPYPPTVMKERWPRTYGYLTRFKEVLSGRGSRTVRELAERTAFYAMFGIGPYTVARYKVVWKRMASDLVAAVVSTHKTPFGHKKVIPTDTTSLIACEDEAEAHYLCALLNSEPVREFVKSFSSAGRGFGAPSVVSHIGIPKFDPKNRLHQRLSKCSQ